MSVGDGKLIYSPDGWQVQQELAEAAEARRSAEWSSVKRRKCCACLCPNRNPDERLARQAEEEEQKSAAGQTLAAAKAVKRGINEAREVALAAARLVSDEARQLEEAEAVAKVAYPNSSENRDKKT